MTRLCPCWPSVAAAFALPTQRHLANAEEYFDETALLHGPPRNFLGAVAVAVRVATILGQFQEWHGRQEQTPKPPQLHLKSVGVCG
eukprot:CAMPEP_0177271542 /NCGR_PEP_ID=MMETSP0367-20130122/65594_1 /TAXON_ID=447022 ORGANISM="Scrippsiella hangoei-like, Strain SHHI-4" /NCGR_SAMPLE_ID=MMETSP0367 /ASSEMBLY_ACC=CAM_ASM_000362 /LENGTH=85 /DNA_ID=CAMNT_0018727627 /DNA_START=29 /DNA_END=287 /DNA_ORIENTATION=+